LRRTLLLALTIPVLSSCGGELAQPPVNPLPPTIGWDIADIGGSPGTGVAFIQPHVIVSLSDGRLRAVDVGTGDPCWERSFGPMSWAANSHHIAVRLPDGTVEGLAPFTGRTVWSTRVAISGDAPPVVTGGKVIVAGDGVCLLTAADGETVWCTKSPEGVTNALGLLDGLVLAGDGQASLVALDAESGQPRWSYSAGSRVLTAPVGDGHHRAFLATDGWIHGVSTRNGKRLWRWRTGCRTTFPGLVLDGHVWFAAQNGILYGLRCRNGNLDTRVALPSRPVGPPLYDGTAFIIPCYSANAGATSLVAVLAKTGGRMGAADVPGEMSVAPILEERRMIVVPRDASLHAYDLALPTPTPEDEFAASPTPSPGAGPGASQPTPTPSAAPSPTPSPAPTTS
jgi:outer membrane protein assembly factor BamB